MRCVETIRRPGNPDKGIKPYVRYQVRLRQSDGRMKYQTFRKYKDAERASRAHEKLLDDGIDLTERTVGELLDEYERARLGPNTRLRVATVKAEKLALAKLRPYFSSIVASKVRQRHVEAFRDETVVAVKARQAARLEALTRKLERIAADKRGVRARRKLAYLADQQSETAIGLDRTGPRATTKALALLRRVFKFAQQRRHIAVNPTDGVEMLKCSPRMDRPLDTNILSVAEVEALLAAIAPEYRAAVMVLAFGGLRVGELLGLTWGDLELSKSRLRVQQQRESATGKITLPKTRAGTRFVELPAFVSQELRQHKLRTEKASPEFVFPYHARRFRDNHFFPALRRAKLRRIRVHDLRHTAASFMIASGVDIASVSRQLGHASVAITLNVYAHQVQQRTESGVGAKLDTFVRRESGGGFLVVSGDAGSTNAA
jgi:integrase